MLACPDSEHIRDIDGFSGLYAITEDGKFYSHKSNRFIKTYVLPNGYVTARPSLNGKRHNFLVHRLVALAFVPNPDNLKFVNHIDGDKVNNHYTNLEWCTRSKNMLHAYKKGLCATAKALTEDQKSMAASLNKKGYTIGELAEIYCVGTTTIQRAIHDGTTRQSS